MADKLLKMAHTVGHFFVSDIYSFYLDTYKGSLGKVQVEVLDCLHDKGNASVKDISEKLNISKQHASKIISKLESEHYVTGQQSGKDARSTIYSLTGEGITFVEKHIAQSDAHLLEYINSLSKSDRDKFEKSLSEIAEIINTIQQE